MIKDDCDSCMQQQYVFIKGVKKCGKCVKQKCACELSVIRHKWEYKKSTRILKGINMSRMHVSVENKL